MSKASGRGYDFDTQRDLGEMAEEEAKRLFGLVGRGRVEVKLDQRAHETGNLYIEFEHQPHRQGPFVPSGVHVCTGEYVGVQMVNGVLVFMPLPWLLEQKEKCQIRLQPDGSYPTHGFLLPLRNLGALR